jgi:hypothetical protein
MTVPNPIPLNNLNLISGTFTGEITCETPGDLAITYTYQTGYYHLFGDLVFIDLHLAINTYSQTTASGDWYISGLPFTVVDNARIRSPLNFAFQGFDIKAGALSIFALPKENTTRCDLLVCTDNDAWANMEVGDGEFNNGDHIRITGWYQRK